MKSKSIQFVQVILVVAIVVLPNLANAFHNCQSTHAASSLDLKDSSSLSTASISNLNQSDSEQLPNSSHKEDCNCPMHRTGCCHSTAYLSSEMLPIILALNSDAEISEAESILKPSPFLDGPFQPPRA